MPGKQVSSNVAFVSIGLPTFLIVWYLFLPFYPVNSLKSDISDFNAVRLLNAISKHS